MHSLKNLDSDTLFPFIMTSGIILIISIFFIPIAAIMLIQDLLFYSPENWSFIRPGAAYKGFGFGMLWIAIVLFSFLFTKMFSEKKEWEYKLTGLHLINLPFAVLVLVLSIYHYAYLNENGVQGNSFWTFTEKSIQWEEVQDVTRLVEEGSLRVISYTFSDGTKNITIPYDSRDYHTSQSITRINQKYNWNITDIIQESGR